jgi:hypothetical protein
MADRQRNDRTDRENEPGEVVQGLSVPRNRAEAQAASDHNREVGKDDHASSISRAEEAARRLEHRHGLKPRTDRSR